jgi:hypothetical protein
MSVPPAATARPDHGVLPPRRAAAARVRVVQAVLWAGAAAVAGFLVVRPGPDRSELGYAAVRAGGDAAWAGHLVESVGYGLLGVGLAAATAVLVRGRGSAWANAGALLVTLGGVMFAATGYALGVLGWYATSSGVDAAAGTSLLAAVERSPGHLAAADVLGFLALSLGTVLVAVALWRSGAVPRWVPAGLALLTLAQFGPWPDRGLDLVQAALALMCSVVGWFAGRTRN